MPFRLYDVARTGTASQFTFRHTVPIAGRNRPLARIHDSRNPDRQAPCPWHADAAEIVAAIPGTSPSQEIVIDLKPNVARNVSLYRLLDVWAYSCPEWTPIALRLEVLFADLRHDDPKLFKSSFNVGDGDRDLVGEFLYLQGGTCGGDWRWGRVGSINGALLWRGAFDYLCGQLAVALGSDTLRRDH